MAELIEYPTAEELTETGPQIGHPIILGYGTGGVIDYIDATHAYSGVMKVRLEALAVLITQQNRGAEWNIAHRSVIERIDGDMEDWQLESLGRGDASL